MTNAKAMRLRGRDHATCPCYCCDGAREIERLETELAYWKARSGVMHGPETDAFKSKSQPEWESIFDKGAILP